MKKEPPDVICVSAPKESPLWKWINLCAWAIEHNDTYLRDRAHIMILKLRNV